MKPAGLLAVIFLLTAFTQEKAILNVEIINIRNHNGVVLISLYTAPGQYPYKPLRSFELKKDSLFNGTLRTTIKDLDPGMDGMCVLDDENRSGAMEYNMIGIPLEGFGFANNVKPLFRRPDYDRIVFRIGEGVNHIQLIIRYKN